MKQLVCLIFILRFFSIIPSNSIELMNFPQEIHALILDDKTNINNILSCNLINSYCYKVALKTSNYQQKLINKVEHICNKGIKRIRFFYNSSTIQISDDISEKNKQKIKSYYQNMYPSFFIKNISVHPAYNYNGWVKPKDHSFSVFSTNYKILEKYESAVITDCVGFNYVTWTLKTTGEKIVIIDIEINTIKNLLEENNDIWLKPLIDDNKIVRIIFSKLYFNSRYTDSIGNNIKFIDLLQKHLLYKPIIIQDLAGTTFFHEACKNKELATIKLYNSINFGVYNNDNNIAWSYALKNDNKKIVQYLIEKNLEKGKLLTRNQYSKLSEKLKKWYLNQIGTYLAQRYDKKVQKSRKSKK